MPLDTVKGKVDELYGFTKRWSNEIIREYVLSWAF